MSGLRIVGGHVFQEFLDLWPYFLFVCLSESTKLLLKFRSGPDVVVDYLDTWRCHGYSAFVLFRYGFVQYGYHCHGHIHPHGVDDAHAQSQKHHNDVSLRHVVARHDASTGWFTVSSDLLQFYTFPPINEFFRIEEQHKNHQRLIQRLFVELFYEFFAFFKLPKSKQ